MHKRFVMCILFCVSALIAFGCAQDVGDIDRTSPGKMKKEIFEGEWYMRSTIVNTPGTGTIGFVGLEGTTERIKWAMYSDSLVAHRVHEDIVGIDTATTPTLGSTDPGFEGIEWNEEIFGAPVARYSISHFDVQRSYNSSTGEQSNVIMENGSDRWWADRDYVRVNWHNRIWSPGNEFFVAIDQFSDAGWYTEGEDESTPINVECRNADGAWYDCDVDSLTDDDEVAYMESTNHYVLYPDWIQCILTVGFPNWGGDCGPEVITVRHSMEKIDEAAVQSYEPRLYSDNEMEWFGFFRTNRCAYDRLYGCRDSGRFSLANNHNIWAGWYDDQNGDGQYLEDDDRYIPYAERTTQPIVYHLSEEYPADLYPESLDIADQYNEIFTEIVQAHGANQATSRMFYLCANSEAQLEGVDATIADQLRAGYNDGVCGRADAVKKYGDIRYSYFGWVQGPQWNGPLGYGPSTTDPITGETIAGNAYIYGAAIDTWAQYTVDLVDLINGELDPEAYGFGENIEGYLDDLPKKLGIPTRGYDFDGTGASTGVTPEDLQRYEDYAVKSAAADERIERWQARGLMVDSDEAVGNLKMGKGALARVNEQIVRHQDTHLAIWENLRDAPELEARFVTPEMKVGLGMGMIGPDDAVTEDVINAIGPRKIGLAPERRPQILPDLPGTLPTIGNALSHDERFHTFASRNMYMAEFLDDGLTGLAYSMRDQYTNPDPVQRRLEMFYDLRGFLFKHVMEHEVGHTVGLRHNFGASYDAVNYDPEYWRIRFEGDAELAAQGLECPDLAGSGIMLGDHSCPTRGLTDADWSKRIQEYAYSSTMDYGARPNSTSQGLGLYDRAALAYSYGELVDVFQERPMKFRAFYEDGFGTVAQAADLGSHSAIERSNIPVTDFDEIDEFVLLRGDSDGDSVDDVIGAVEAGEDLDAVNLTGISGGAGGNALDYWHFSVLPVMFNAESAGNMDAMYARQLVPASEYSPDNDLRVPYRFCSDFFRGATPYCDVWDDGSDFAELSDRFRRDYSNYYVLNSYRRGRPGYGLWLGSHINRLLGRYFVPMSNLYQHWLIRASSYPAWQFNPWGGGNQAQVAIEDGLRELMHVLVSPHPGTYEATLLDPNDPNSQVMYENVSSDTGVAVSENLGAAINFEPGIEAKWRFSRFDYDSGYYYFLRYRILSSFWDRYAAFIALTNPTFNTIGVDATSDITAYLIPYYLLYDSELSRAFGSIMVEDFDDFAPVVNLTTGEYEHRDQLGSAAQLAAYKDNTRYALLNPYAASYGNSGFNDRYFAALYGTAMFQVLYDKSFNHGTNIQKLGSGGYHEVLVDSDNDGLYDVQEPRVDEDGDNILAPFDADEQPANPLPLPDHEIYTDTGGNTWIAVQFRRAVSPVYSPGLALLRKAHEVEACAAAGDCSPFEIDNIREDIETFRELNAIFAGLAIN